jgi:small-conductance mechanosensitive channel
MGWGPCLEGSLQHLIYYALSIRYVDDMKFDFSLAADRSHEILQAVVASLPNIALAVAAFLIMLLAGLVAGRQVRRAVARTRAHYGLQNLLATLTRVAFGALGVVLGLGILGIDAAAIVAGLGVAGLVFGIAFKDILENFIAGIVLLVRQPFTVGDRVVTNGVEGVVTDVNTRNTILKTYDGEEVLVPNGAVLRAPVTNRTAYPVSRTVIPLRIAYGADLGRALEAVEAAIRSVPDVRTEPAPEVVAVDFADNGIAVQARYWTESAGNAVNRASVAARVAIKRALDEAGVAFAPAPGLGAVREGEREAGSVRGPRP